MKSNRFLLTTLIAFSIYMVLATINLFTGSYDFYQSSTWVITIGEFTNKPFISALLLPGEFIGLILWPTQGKFVAICGQVIVFLFGVLAILNCFGLRLRNIADAFDNWVRSAGKGKAP